MKYALKIRNEISLMIQKFANYGVFKVPLDFCVQDYKRAALIKMQVFIKRDAFVMPCFYIMLFQGKLVFIPPETFQMKLCNIS